MTATTFVPSDPRDLRNPTRRGTDVVTHDGTRGQLAGTSGLRDVFVLVGQRKLIYAIANVRFVTTTAVLESQLYTDRGTRWTITTRQAPDVATRAREDCARIVSVRDDA
jgi:hypothetical protein